MNVLQCFDKYNYEDNGSKRFKIGWILTNFYELQCSSYFITWKFISKLLVPPVNRIFSDSNFEIFRVVFQNDLINIEGLSLFAFSLINNWAASTSSVAFFYETLVNDIVFRSIVRNFPKAFVIDCFIRKRAKERISHCYICRSFWKVTRDHSFYMIWIPKSTLTFENFR